MNIAEQIIQSVSMPDLAEHYGIPVNRSGSMRCPFHNEKTASLKLYPGDRGWYCFGCGSGGNVIHFVQRYFNLDFSNAVTKLNNDFCLGLETSTYRSRRKTTEASREVIVARIHRKRSMQEYNAIYGQVTDYYRQCWAWLKTCQKPSHEYFKMIQRVEYMDYWFNENRTFEKWEVNGWKLIT